MKASYRWGRWRTTWCWGERAFPCEKAAAVGGSLPAFPPLAPRTRRKVATFSTSDSSKSSPQRRGAVKVTPELGSTRRVASPSPARPPATPKRTEGSGDASLHPIRQNVQTIPELNVSRSAGGRKGAKRAPNPVSHHRGMNPSETEPQLGSRG